MRTPFTVFAVVLSLLWIVPSHAQEHVGTSDFDSRAKRNFQRVDVEYLRPDQKLEERNGWLQRSEPSRDSTAQRRQVTSGERAFAIMLLIGLMALLGYLWWRNRLGGGLFGRTQSDKFREEDDDDNELLKAAKKGEQSLSNLSEIVDPREGLHALLVQSLVRAANQNGINLRRSLTTRDVLNRVPKEWKHYGLLKRLADQAELVFFGGRNITREDYERALAMASALLNEKSLSKAGRR